MGDLCTLDYAQEMLPQYKTLASLPDLITASSVLIEKTINCQFTQTDYDELYDGDGGGILITRNRPVNSITRLMGTLDTVMTVAQTDSTTNQIATAALATTGDFESGLTVTGLTLSRTASGVTTTNAVSFSANETLSSVATAINALGNGWSATVADSNLGKWPAAELVPLQGAGNCLGPGMPFKIHTTVIGATITDPRAGIIRLDAGSYDPIFAFWSGYGGAGLGVGQIGNVGMPLGPSAMRLKYNAGYATIPAPVQLACAETVKAAIELAKTDVTLQGETDGAYSYSVASIMNRLAIPPEALRRLAPYRFYHL